MRDEHEGLGDQLHWCAGDDVRVEVVFDADLGVITAMFDDAGAIVLTMVG